MESISTSASPVSILLVEDEKIMLELLSVILAKKFPEIVFHSVASGKTGLELFKTYSPDVVITDFNMPEMSGGHMVDKIRTLGPDAKCIVITGKSEKTDIQDFVAKGVVFDRFIEKPFVFRNCLRL